MLLVKVMFEARLIPSSSLLLFLESCLTRRIVSSNIGLNRSSFASLAIRSTTNSLALRFIMHSCWNMKIPRLDRSLNLSYPRSAVHN